MDIWGKFAVSSWIIWASTKLNMNMLTEGGKGGRQAGWVEWGDGSGGGVEGGFRGQGSGEGFGLSSLGRLDQGRR